MASNIITQHEPLILALPNKRVIIVTLAVVFMIIVGLALRSQLLTPRFLHIASMKVYGELSWIDREQLNVAVEPYLESNFFGADIDGIKQTVESLPWVASASVRRQWPNQLQIAIEEHKAVARWGDNVLVNDKGELFQPAEIPEDLVKSLVQLQGPDNTYQYLFAQYQELQPMFSAQGLGAELRIAKVYLNERRALGIELTNSMRIIFGRLSASMDLYNVASRFLQAFKNHMQEHAGQIEVVDLRYTNGFAVQWKNSDSKTVAN
ncbi:MAG: hypothetical protein AMJ53_04850 [Gammaproteobacteria bacterium SG8_11]|nr:MAG: hypothetical protein AMJ53_04850 [Gammaproteobacteria bacterium SG8_11]